MKEIKDIWFSGGMGDLIQFTPGLKKFREENPGVHVRLILPENKKQMSLAIMAHVPYFDELIFFPGPKTCKRPVGKKRMPMDDWYIAYGNAVKEAYPSIRSHGMLKQDKEWMKCSGIYKSRLQRLAFSIPVTLKDHEKKLEVFTSPEDIDNALKIWQRLDINLHHPTIMIAPTSRSPKKHLTVEEIDRAMVPNSWQVIEVGINDEPFWGKRGRYFKFSWEKFPPRVTIALLGFCKKVICAESMLFFAAIALRKEVHTALKGQGWSNYQDIVDFGKYVKIVKK